ncbi:MAG TPA: hypothetical protein PLV92_25565, partial [Pirellulaceae bacterium]|nr:hypothetical protein [Pirellulaceae bacterium]
VVVGTRIVEDGTVTEDEVHYVPTTVTEQTGTTLVKIGTAYHTLDIKLAQDGYFNGHTIREYFVQNVDYQNEEIPWTSYSRQPDGKVVFTGQTPAPENPVPAPDILATFAQLTDDQQNVVLAHLGYMKLYNFSYTNGQTYQTINGNTTVLAWTPEWANDDLFIHYFNYPGIEDKYIRLPEGAIPQFLRVVSQGSRTLPDETVGRYRDHADVLYSQDRSTIEANDNNQDFDSQSARFYVTAVAAPAVVVDGEEQTVRGGSRQFEIFDGRVIGGVGGDRSVSYVSEPIWYEGELPDAALDVSPNIGFDPLGKRVMSQDGYLADSASLAGAQLVGLDEERFVGITRVVNYSVLQLGPVAVEQTGGWWIPPDSYDWRAGNSRLPATDPGLNVNQDLINRGFNLAHDIQRYAFNSRLAEYERGEQSSSFCFGGCATYT